MLICYRIVWFLIRNIGVERLGQLLRRLFHVYPGEEKRAFLFAALAFFWAFSVTCGNKFSEALFLLNVGPDSLPTSYILTAIVMLAASLVMLQAIKKFSPYQIFAGVMLIAACCYTLVFTVLMFGVDGDATVFWYLMKVNGYTFLTIVLTSFWLFVDDYFHLQDAKRFFCLFNSAVFLGAASTGIVMHFAVLSLSSLLLLILALIGATVGVSFYISQKITPCHDEESIVVTDRKQGSIFFLVKAIFSSRFTRLLMGSCLLTFLLATMTEYSYFQAFTERFTESGGQGLGEGGTEAALTQFIGKCFATVSVINLLIGLFIYSRMVRRIGVYNMVLCTPIMLLIAFSGWVTTDILFFPIIGFFVVEGSLYVIEDSNISLLLNGVPKQIRRQVRVLMEAFCEPAGMLLSGLILEGAFVDSRALGLGLAFASLVIEIYLGREYLFSIYNNLKGKVFQFGRTIKQWVESVDHKEKDYVLAKCLMCVKENRKESLFAAETLLAMGDEKILEELFKAASQLDDSKKREMLDLVRRWNWEQHPIVLRVFEKWGKQTNTLSLQGELHLILASVGRLDLDSALEDMACSEPERQGAGIMSFLVSDDPTQDEWIKLARVRLEQLLTSDIERDVLSGLRVLSQVGTSSDLERVISLMSHSSMVIATEAALACSILIDTSNAHYFSILISLLVASSDSVFRKHCLKSIGKVACPVSVKVLLQKSFHFRPKELRLLNTIFLQMGARSISPLTQFLVDSKESVRCRTYAGKVLGKVSKGRLQEVLYDVLREGVERAYIAFYHSQTILEPPGHHLNQVISALNYSFESSINFIVQLLSTAGAIEDPELMIRALRGKSIKVRSQVVEMLEKTSEGRFFRLLFPLIGEIPVEEKLRIYRRGGREEMDLPKLLDWMSRSSSELDQMVAFAMKRELDLNGWQEEVRERLKKGEERLSQFGDQLLEAAVV